MELSETREDAAQEQEQHKNHDENMSKTDEENALERSDVSSTSSLDTYFTDLTDEHFRGRKGGRALLGATQAGDLDAVQFFIKKGAEITCRSDDSDALTPLLIASKNGHFEIVRFLVEHGADVNDRDRGRQKTALHLAAWYRHLSTVQCLVRLGAGLVAKDARGRTTLYYAA